MFERFMNEARRVVVLSQEEARRLNYNYIGTEHLLLGLIHEPGTVAARALEAAGIDLEHLRVQVEQVIGCGPRAPDGHIPFTPGVREVFELSGQEAGELHDRNIGPEHLLLGLIREGTGIAAQVLTELGADLPSTRDQVVRLKHSPEDKQA